VDGRFKAMVVAASRRACALYQEGLGKHLPKEYFDVVMTHSREDEEIIHRSIRESWSKYGGREAGDLRNLIVDKFKEEEFPKILIVTDMLLTGFDAPVLQTMYLDKPLKEHRLLQAVARTNRPHKGVKEAGVVIDYVGVLKEFKRALEIYSTEDIEGALFSYDSLREEFITLIQEILEALRDVPRDYERETLLRAVEVLTADREKEKEFIEKYRKLRRVFELLGPDEVKLEHLETYKWISAIYTY